ncbi:MAG: hypothetical protein ACYTGZ_02820 [Planctomycetota bacterium]|jgi:hypothetical protein
MFNSARSKDLFIAFGATIGFLAAVRVFGALVPAGAAITEFFFERSVVQFVTVGLLAHAFTTLFRRARDARRLLAEATDDSALPAGPVAARIEKVRKCKDQLGSAAAASYAQELSENGDEELHAFQDAIGTVKSLVLGCGLLGSLIGIRLHLFGNVRDVGGASAEELGRQMSDLSSGFGTALDTSAAAMVGVLLVTIAASIVRALDTRAHAAVNRAVTRAMDLELSEHASRTEASRDARAAMVKLVKQTRKVLLDTANVTTKAIASTLEKHTVAMKARETRIGTDLASQLAAAYRKEAGRSIQAFLADSARGRTEEQAARRRLDEAADERVARLVRAIASDGKASREQLARDVESIARDLEQRVPTALTVSFPDPASNGSAPRIRRTAS